MPVAMLGPTTFLGKFVHSCFYIVSTFENACENLCCILLKKSKPEGKEDRYEVECIVYLTRLYVVSPSAIWIDPILE
jgi:hypothetical protein